MITKLLSSRSLLTQFLVFNLLAFIILGFFTFLYLKAIQPELIAKQSSKHLRIIKNIEANLNIKKIDINKENLKSFLTEYKYLFDEVDQIRFVDKNNNILFDSIFLDIDQNVFYKTSQVDQISLNEKEENAKITANNDIKKDLVNDPFFKKHTQRFTEENSFSAFEQLKKNFIVHTFFNLSLENEYPLFIIVSEVSNEIMLAVEERKNFVLRSVIVVAIVISIFSLFLNAYIIKPIRLLNIFANDTSPEKKNMNVVHKIETRTDEIGNLSRSLNEMTSKLYNRIDLAEIAIFSLFLNAYIIKPIRLLNIFANDTSPEKKNMNVVHKIETRTDEIGNLSRSLNEMTSKLYNRIDLAERFASDLTHEIRNPLASLKGASELLNNTSDNLKREKLLKIVSNDVDRIERLITDYSQVLKDEASQSRSIPKDFDLVSVIESVIEDFNTDTKTMDKNISIRFENLLQNNKAIIFGIESRIEQVIANVLENAISFSPIKSEVEISLSKKNNLVQMLIRDKGPGFDEKNVNKIFERFYSDRPDLSSVNHSGLGLNIVKNIIDSHKGSIEAYNYYKNKKLGGAVIDIKLPSKN